MHRREQRGPWREKGDREVSQDNDAAKPEIWRKRINGLAKQSCTGLQTVCGISVDASSFASQLTEAYKTRDRFTVDSGACGIGKGSQKLLGLGRARFAGMSMPGAGSCVSRRRLVADDYG